MPSNGLAGRLLARAARHNAERLARRFIAGSNLEEALRTLEHAEKSGNRTRNEASTDLRFVISEAKHIIRNINAMHHLLSTKLPNYEPYQRAKK